MAEDRPGRADARGLLLHVGYHKAGSTWLQQVLFSDEALGFRLPFERNDVNLRVVAPKQLLFDASATRDAFAPLLAAEPARVPVISNERLSGNPHSGGWDSGLLADRLATLFPEARVLIVIREQRAAIRSAYLQYVREGGAESLAGYLAPPEAGRFRRPFFDFDFFAYDALIERYQQRFGRDDVLVLPYELLATSPLDFASHICRFAGATPPTKLPDQRPNVSLSALAARLKRPLNRALVRDTLNPSPTLPLSLSLSLPNANIRLRHFIEAIDQHLPKPLKDRSNKSLQARINTRTANRYTRSNKRTAELTNLNLTKYGYT